MHSGAGTDEAMMGIVGRMPVDEQGASPVEELLAERERRQAKSGDIPQGGGAS